MPSDMVSDVIEALIDVVPKIFGDLGNGVGARDLPQISGPMAARNIIDNHSLPRLSFAERNNLDEGPCGVPQYNFDMCADSLQGVTILSSTPGPGQAQFENIPPTCMVLSTVLAGACDQSQRPGPVPCGSACLLYTELTDEDLNHLKEALNI
ncbi:hypothetical protein F5Y06DRAFT_306364 [Hypoxylon sp. FL0890]|nr:hypothetical protein F5Y06DRAFT_306364 [Hypoxylon sp. FL0890]